MKPTYDLPDHPVPAHPTMELTETFSWTRFKLSASVEISTNPGGAYTVTVEGTLNEPRGSDIEPIEGETRQLWTLVISLPVGSQRGDSSSTTIEKRIAAPGWREAIEYARLRANDIAVKATVAAEGRRLFNLTVARWTNESEARAMPYLDVEEAVGVDVLSAIGSAYSGRYRLVNDPFDDGSPDADDVN